MKCLLLSSDLLFGAQAAQAAREAGYEVHTLGDLAMLSATPLDGVDLILADLSMPQFDAPSLAERVGQSQGSRPELLAVGPHVHHAKLTAARDAGWRVYTRGQFHAGAARILANR